MVKWSKFPNALIGRLFYLTSCECEWIEHPLNVSECKCTPLSEYEHLLTHHECDWGYVTGCEHPWMQFTARECLWVMKTPHKHNWVQANTFWMSIEHPWMQSSAHEWLWVSIEKGWMCTSISQVRTRSNSTRWAFASIFMICLNGMVMQTCTKIFFCVEEKCT